MTTTPDGRELRVRRAARVLVLDADERLLLIHDSDRGYADRPTFWITPGGGLDGDETPAQAAVRELFEETGLRVGAADLIGPVWFRATTTLDYSDHRAVQEETFFALRTAAFEPDEAGLTPEEQATVLGSRWWSLQELAATEETVWPRDLPGLLPDALRGIRSGNVVVRELPAGHEDTRDARGDQGLAAHDSN